MEPGARRIDRVRLREEIVNPGSNEVVIIPSSVMPAAAAGPKLAWLDPAEDVGVRLWYARVIPYLYFTRFATSSSVAKSATLRVNLISSAETTVPV